eukprot:6487406-Amphidinium_carterae.1
MEHPTVAYIGGRKESTQQFKIFQYSRKLVPKTLQDRWSLVESLFPAFAFFICTCSTTKASFSRCNRSLAYAPRIKFGTRKLASAAEARSLLHCVCKETGLCQNVASRERSMQAGGASCSGSVVSASDVLLDARLAHQLMPSAQTAWWWMNQWVASRLLHLPGSAGSANSLYVSGFPEVLAALWTQAVTERITCCRGPGG